jgi:integrase
VTFHGTKEAARKKLRDLLSSADKGTHVAPDKITLKDWVDHWITAGAPGRRQKKVNKRTLERYAELLRCHVVPTLGDRPLQQIQSGEIDNLYVKLGEKIAPQTAHHVHTTFGACLGAAVRTGLLSLNPMARLLKVPSPGEADHGMILDEDQLRTLVEGFRGLVLFPIVAVAAFTGARRNEILALRCTDLDASNKTLRIERALEETSEGLSFKEPKTARGKRTISIDDDLVALLLAEREKLVRIKAGIPEGAQVDLSLVKLPADALFFPNPPAAGENFSFSKPRNPRNTKKEFVRKARKLGFPELRFHDLRGTHETLLLDRDVKVHVVAERCGHDPAVLLRTYAKRTKKADASAAAVIGSLSKGLLRS